MTQEANSDKQLKIIAGPDGCGCDTSSSCCDDPVANKETKTSSCCDNSVANATSKDITITIDGQVLEVAPGDKNIVDVANRAKIGIPVACYRAQRKKGCCHGCVVEVDGEQKYACSTPPANGMNIVVNREDLKAIRKKNLLEYNEGIKSGNFVNCSVTGSSNCSC